MGGFCCCDLVAERHFQSLIASVARLPHRAFSSFPPFAPHIKPHSRNNNSINHALPQSLRFHLSCVGERIVVRSLHVTLSLDVPLPPTPKVPPDWCSFVPWQALPKSLVQIALVAGRDELVVVAEYDDGGGVRGDLLRVVNFPLDAVPFGGRGLEEYCVPQDFVDHARGVPVDCC